MQWTKEQCKNNLDKQDNKEGNARPYHKIVVTSLQTKDVDMGYGEEMHFGHCYSVSRAI